MSVKRIVGWVLFIGIVAVLGFSVARAIGKKKNYKPPESIEDIQKREGVPVTVEHPVVTNLVGFVALDGSVEPWERSFATAELQARVARILVEEGDRVTAAPPTLLVELDNTARAANVEAAAATYLDAQVSEERAKRLYESGAIPRQEMDTAAVLASSARARLVDARYALENCRVYAPAAGIVARRYVDAGTVVKAGDKMIEIVDTTRLKIEVRIPEKSVQDVRAGMPCRVEIGALGPDGRIATALAKVNPELDPGSRELLAVCHLNGGPEGAVPGMFARVFVESSRREGVLVVPEESVVHKGGTTGVFVVEDGLAVLRTVTTGMRYNGVVEVTAGLTPRDRVVTDGVSRLKEGTRVLLTNEEPPGGPSLPQGEADVSGEPRGA